jgi:hypothetical protein
MNASGWRSFQRRPSGTIVALAEQVVTAVVAMQAELVQFIRQGLPGAMESVAVPPSALVTPKQERAEPAVVPTIAVTGATKAAPAAVPRCGVRPPSASRKATPTGGP